MKDTSIFKIQIIIIIALASAILYIPLVLQPEKDARMRELDNYCISKGYEYAMGNWIRERGDQYFIECISDNVYVDDKGVADFSRDRDWIVFTGKNK